VLVLGYFAVAAFFGLVGTTNQTGLAKRRLLSDPDPDIAAAALLWRPRPLILTAFPRKRQAIAAVEARIRVDPERWEHYRELCQELSAWNYIESSVALAFAGSVMAILFAWKPGH
jgi:ABC-type glycerol-3-phosphate transport system permease component